jgi:hypothetical protein
MFDLGNNLFNRQAFFTPPHQGHDTVGAEAIAAILNLDEGTSPGWKVMIGSGASLHRVWTA